MPPIALVLRQPDDQTTIQLAKRGYQAVYAPLLDYTPLTATFPHSWSAAAIILSSARTLSYLGKIPDLDTLKKIPLAVVGAHTAIAATKAGWPPPTWQATDGADLAKQLLASSLPHGATLAHFGGLPAAPEPAQTLALQFDYQHYALYQAVAVAQLPPALLQVAQAASPTAIPIPLLLLSAHAAATLATLFAHTRISSAHLAVHCLSSRVAAPLAQRPWAALQVATTPDLAALLATLPPATTAT